MSRVGIVVGSIRPGRVGAPVGRWVAARAEEHGGFDEVVLLDLAEVGLPLLDEPELPRFGRYVHEHTRRWSEVVAACDAFVFVTPEYNLAPAASLKNAVDFLHQEWWFKAGAVVSYGGPAGGVRAAQLLKQSLGAVSCFVVHEAVMIPLVGERIEGDELVPPDGADTVAKRMFDALELLSVGLSHARLLAQTQQER
jgi:NAD(P)H-dependent FMN reductase